MEERKNAEIHRKSKEERAQKALEDEETLMSIEEKESNNLNVEVETFAQVQFHVFFFSKKILLSLVIKFYRRVMYKSL